MTGAAGFADTFLDSVADFFDSAANAEDSATTAHRQKIMITGSLFIFVPPFIVLLPRVATNFIQS
jgi:hypothetical protein